MRNESKKMGLNDILGHENNVIAGRNFLAQVQERGRSDIPIPALAKLLGDREKAIDALNNPAKYIPDINKAIEENSRNAREGFYGNAEAILREIPDREYAMRMDVGKFEGLIRDDSELYPVFEEYVGAAQDRQVLIEQERGRGRKIIDDDEESLKKIIKREEKIAREEALDNLRNSKDPYVLKLSDKVKEMLADVGGSAYATSLRRGEIIDFIKDRYDEAKSRYDEAFGGEKGKANYARGLVKDLVSRGEEDRELAYKIFIDLNTQEQAPQMREAA